MTGAQKKMKKYMNAVERQLNLPRQIKIRVMSEFSSDLQARRETGMTDEEIYAELGTPKQAAANINEQMKEYAYRKSPWRFLFAACAAYGAAELIPMIFGCLSYWILRAWAMLTPNEAVSVGIIGGADGPTAIFLTTPVWMHYLLPAAALVVGILGYLRLRKCRQK